MNTLLVVVCLMANYSYGWTGKAVNDLSADGVAWQQTEEAEQGERWNGKSDPEHATGATAVFTTVPESTKYLRCTDFQWSHPIPSTAKITGIRAWLELSDNADSKSIVLSEAKLVVGGRVVGNDRSTGETLVRQGEQTVMNFIIGDVNDDWGNQLTPDICNSKDFGVAIRCAGNGTAATAMAVGVKLVVYWTDKPQCIIEPTTPTQGHMAPYVFHARSDHSIVGEKIMKEDAVIRWAVTEFPDGWTMTCDEPRDANALPETVNLATEQVGWNAAWLFDVPGKYTVTATLYLQSGKSLEEVHAIDPILVQVDQNSRERRYVDSVRGDDSAGGGVKDPWRSIQFAIPRLRDHFELVLVDGSSWNFDSKLDLSKHVDVVVRRSGGGEKPAFLGSSDFISVSGSEGLVVSGIRCLGVEDHRIDFIDGYGCPRLSVVDCEGPNLDSFAEIESGASINNHFYLRNSASVKRYGVFIDGRSHDTVCLGNQWRSAPNTTGEGQFRFAANREPKSPVSGGARASVQFNDCYSPIDNPRSHAGVRAGWTHMSIHGNKFSGKNTIGLAEGAGSGAHHMNFCQRWSANQIETEKISLWPRSQSHQLLSENILIGPAFDTNSGGLGNGIDVMFRNNTFLLTGARQSSTFMRAHQNSGYNRNQLALFGNLFILDDASSPQWDTSSSNFWIQMQTTNYIRSSRYNAYNKIGPDKFWQLPSGSMSFAQWNELPFVDHEMEADIREGDIKAKDNYIPTKVLAIIDDIPISETKGMPFDFLGRKLDVSRLTVTRGAVQAVSTNPISGPTLKQSGTDLVVEFLSQRKLIDIHCHVSGPLESELTANDFTCSGNGPYTYVAVVTLPNRGTQTVSLRVLRDAGGEDFATGKSESINVAGVATSLTLTPSSATVQAGREKRFFPNVQDQFGNSIAPSGNWTMDAGDGSIDSAGLFEASDKPGTALVRFSQAGKSAQARILIQAEPVESDLPRSGYAVSTVKNPSSGLDDFTLLVDLKLMPGQWWQLADTPDGSRGRVAKDESQLELASDWIDFNQSTKTGWVRVKWSESLDPDKVQKLRIYPPVSTNDAYPTGHFFGQHSAYDGGWTLYLPSGSANDRTINQQPVVMEEAFSSTGGNVGVATSYKIGSGSSINAPSAVNPEQGTLMAWIRSAPPGDGAIIYAGADKQDLFGKGPEIYLSQHQGRVCLGVYDGNVGEQVQVDGRINDDQWHHFAGTYDAGSLQAWQDFGSMKQTKRTSSPFPGSALRADMPLISGIASGKSFANRALSADYDEVQIHSVARSKEWISHEFKQSENNIEFWRAWTWQPNTN